MEVGATGSTAAQAQDTTGQSNAMGKEDFLKLLMAQLRYQNPLQPAGDMEFMGQLAQFTSLEQLDNIYTEINTLNQRLESMLGSVREQGLSAALNLVGQNIRAETPQGESLAGSVTGVRLREGQPYLLLADREVSLDWLQEVGPQVTLEGSDANASTAP